MDARLAISSLFLACSIFSNQLSAQWKATPMLKTSELMDRPTNVANLPDGMMIITERFKGRLRLFDPKTGQLDPRPFTTVPSTFPKDERGLIGVAVSRDFSKAPYVFVYQHHNNIHGQVVGRVIRYTAIKKNGIYVGSKMKVLKDDIFSFWSRAGGRMSMGPDNKLYVSVGDSGQPQRSQDMRAFEWSGKVNRINLDGTIPSDNPFGKTKAFYSVGIRNGFGLTWHPVLGKLYESENGPTTNDELQILRPGGNFGWPKELGNQGKPGYDKPILTWTPTIAPTGLAFAYSKAYPASVQLDLFLCDYNNNQVRILKMGGNPADKVLSTSTISGIFGPTDCIQASDGKIYVISHGTGNIYRLDWTGKAPTLPDLTNKGTPKIGFKNILTQRGRPGSFMVLMIGVPLTPPLATLWGKLEVQKAAFIQPFGPANNTGIYSLVYPIPNNQSLKGLKFRMQTLELKLDLSGAMTNPIDVTIK